MDAMILGTDAVITDMEFIAYAVVAGMGVPIYLLMRKITKRIQYKRMFRD